MKLLDCLSEQWPLRDILPGFSPRPQQTQMAQVIEEDLANGQKVIIEAGTGVGKSLAYLLPSAIWATENKKKVIVATHTKALQEQLIDKDLPVVQKILKAKGVDLNFSLLMGSENYLCLQRLYRTLEGGADLFASATQQGILENVAKWADGAITGLHSKIPLDGLQEVWESINRDPDICLGKKGPYWETCLWRKDVNRVRDANILVVNQHLLLKYLLLPSLPRWFDFGAIVIDEAHNLEDVAVSCLGVELTEQKIKRLLDDTFNPKTSRGVVVRMRELPPDLRDEIKGDVNKVHKASTEFFIAVRDKLGLVQGSDMSLGTNAKRVLEPSIVEDRFTGLLENIHTSLQQRCLVHSSDSEEEHQLAALSKRYSETVEQIRRFLKCEEKDHVYWGELQIVREKPSMTLCVKPIDVSAALRKLIFDKKFPVILTSATLSVKKSFQHFKERVGATEMSEHLIDSPFDYESNARLLVPDGFPNPSTKVKEYDQCMVKFCSQVVEHVPGGIFFLFRSWRTLKTVAAAIKSNGVKRTLFIQGDEPTPKLLENFKSAKNGLLLGTNTFWEGVDVPGPELSCVVITKLPFMPPDTPMEQARKDWYKHQGKNPFNDYVLPRAVINFRQGFGRLIRTQRDFGAVIVLDSRLRTGKYRKVFLDSIPACPEVSTLEDISEFFATKTQSNLKNPR